jgi:predicted small integral membrane protein
MTWWESVLAQVLEMLPKEAPAAMVAMMGAISQYLYQIQKGTHTFQLSRFFITCFLGLYMGMLLGKFLPLDMAYRDGWLSLSGFAMYQIFFVLDTYLSGWFKLWMDKRMNGLK